MEIRLLLKAALGAAFGHVAGGWPAQGLCIALASGGIGRSVGRSDNKCLFAIYQPLRRCL